MTPMLLIISMLTLASLTHTNNRTEAPMNIEPTPTNLKKSNPQNVTVLGEGAWGSAIALLLADNGHNVTLWCYDENAANTIKKTGYNSRYLPEIPFNPAITVTTDLSHALNISTWIFETTPIIFLRSILQQAQPYARADHIWVTLSKGIEEHTHLLPTQIITDVLGQDTKTTVCMGPSFAREVAQKQCTAISVAAQNEHLGNTLALLLKNDYFHPYQTTDVIGVQVAAALKNGIALGMGILEGAQYGQNTKAFFVSQALQEMTLLVEALGGTKETVYGLSGIGDTLLTCTSSQSKNTTVGRLLGAGQSLEQILKETGYFPEGLNTLKSINYLMRAHHLSLPAYQGVYDIIQGTITTDTMLAKITQPVACPE